MFLAEVITGEYCEGNSALEYTDIYDSVVDNVSNANIFVVFKNRRSVYPFYLLKYTSDDII